MVKVVILTAGFSLMACNAPVTIVSPTNGEVSTDPVYIFTLRFGKSFVSQSGDGLYIWTGTPEPTGTPYAWGLFAPSPAAGVTKSGIQPDGGCPEYTSTPVSLGIAYTCGWFCFAGIPKFTFQPPHLELSSGGSTTHLPFGNCTPYSVLYYAGKKKAAPSYEIAIGIRDVTPGGPATELSLTSDCSAPASDNYIKVNISPPGSTANFYVNAKSPKYSNYTLQADACGCATGTLSGKIK